MDEINESFKQHVLREQLESESESSSDFDQYYDEGEDDDEEIQYYEYGHEANVTSSVNGFVRKPINHIVGDDSHDVYDFKAFSVINITFGLLDGALNAMPRGGFLYECGENNQK